MSSYRIGMDAGLHPPISSMVPAAALQECLSDTEIEAICDELGHVWRNRKLPPATMVRSMVYRSLHHDRSIAAVLADLAAEAELGQEVATDSAWCQARSNLPLGLWPELILCSALRLMNAVGDDYTYNGRPVYLFDGTTLSMPDEPDLVEAFGYTDSKHGRSRFPVARVSILLRWGVWAVVDHRMDEYRCSEDEQLHDMWHNLPDGCLCIMDEYFSGFHNLAKLSQRSIGVITPLHHRRDPWKLIHEGRRLGRNHWRVWLDLDGQLRKKYDDPTLPECLAVRLIRVPLPKGAKKPELWVVTTLLDERRYPRKDIERWFRRRWPVETRIGSLKTTLQMNVLRSKTAVGVRSEVAATILTHNLVWTVIHQAAVRHRRRAERISFACAVKLILAFSDPIRRANGTARRQLYQRMLRLIAGQTNRDRPNRVEPRMIKRETAHFAYLREPRWKARLKCLT